VAEFSLTVQARKPGKQKIGSEIAFAAKKRDFFHLSLHGRECWSSGVGNRGAHSKGTAEMPAPA
jgi:hypothetical protein